MPQQVEFTIPIRSWATPELDAARKRNLRWARRMGLVSSGEAERRYLFSQVADVAAYSYPDAEGEDLDLAFDVNGWFFLFDDQFDVPLGQWPPAATVCEELIDLLHRPPGTPPAVPSPLADAFADVWQRMARGMSPRWQERTAQHWIEYLAANLTEAVDRRAGMVPNSEEWMRLRRKVIGVRPSIDVCERVGHFEVPAPVVHSTALESAREIVTDVIILINEVYSLENDEARDAPNLVRCLMHEWGHTRPQAIDELRRRADAHVERLEDMRRQITSLGQNLGLPRLTQEAADRYIDAISAYMRGIYDWHRLAGRYTPQVAQLASPTTTGYLNVENLATSTDRPTPDRR
ncbi:pentalenene synthase [Streptomyces sp. NPDC059982]|uniref:terpene synthase family protein n=1 Tax=unclassified Streptomyces TaxID=2593676 RepID=UPI00369E954F